MIVNTYLMPEGAADTDVGGVVLQTIGQRVSLDVSPDPSVVYDAAIAAGWVLVDVGAVEDANPAAVPQSVVDAAAEIAKSASAKNVTALDSALKAAM